MEGRLPGKAQRRSRKESEQRWSFARLFSTFSQARTWPGHRTWGVAGDTGRGGVWWSKMSYALMKRASRLWQAQKTPLGWAASHGSVQAVRHLIQAKDGTWDTLFDLPRIRLRVPFLLKARASLNAREQCGWTPIHWAAGHPNAARILDRRVAQITQTHVEVHRNWAEALQFQWWIPVGCRTKS